MTEDQRAEWRKALRRRGQAATQAAVPASVGLYNVRGAGMVRIPAPRTPQCSDRSPESDSLPGPINYF